MLRVLFCLLFLAVGPSGVVSSLWISDAGCAQACEDDDERGQCAPDCVDCACCAHPVPTALPATLTAWAEPPGSPRVESTVRIFESAAPADLLDPPIIA